MARLVDWLTGGDLRSDGASNQVVQAVLQNEQLMADLAEGLSHEDERVRGRTMDAFEKIARTRPELVQPYLPQVLALLKSKHSMMTRMHAAKLLGDLALYAEEIPRMLPALLLMLEDPKTFTKSWTISSLCIIARKFPQYHQEIAERIRELENDPGAAIRTRVGKALRVLSDPNQPFPKGWIKSEKLRIK
jgi:HEAT repeat protein